LEKILSFLTKVSMAATRENLGKRTKVLVTATTETPSNQEKILSTPREILL